MALWGDREAVTDIRDYRFDLGPEAQHLIKTLGERAANILFVNVSTNPDVKPAQVTFHSILGGAKVTEEAMTKACRRAEEYYSEKPDGSSFAIPLDAETGCCAVIINNNTPAADWFGNEFRDLCLLRGLYHELDHILDPEGEDVDELHPYREGAADAYFAIRMLQRFGQAVAPFLTLCSWARAHDAMMFSTSHLTTTVLDKIISDSVFYNNFSSLSPEQTITRAAKYARDWTPTADALSDAIKVFTDAKKDATRLRDIVEKTCESSGIALIVGATVGGALTRKEGLVYCGNHGQLPEEKRNDLASTISTGLASLEIEPLFNSAAPRPPSQPAVQPLRIPAGKPLVYNPA
jgi:hypothetical protein